MRRLRGLEAAAQWLLIGTVAIAAWALAYVADDVFIFQRFAANAAAGNGLVYNIGERVEGFTSPLWMAIHVALQVVRATSIGWAQGLGVLATIGLLFVVMRAPRGWRQESDAAWVDWIAACLVASHVGVLTYAASGMETSLYCLLVALAVTCRAQERADARRAPLSALWCALALWARPEAAVIGVVCAALLVGDWRAGRRGFVARWIALAGVPVCVLLALRWGYYGDWLPNTWYAKRLPPVETLRAGGAYVATWLLANSGWPAIAVALMVPLRRALPAGFGVVPLCAAAMIAATLATPGDWMPFDRFLLPAVVLASLCAGEAVRIARRHGQVRFAAFAVGVALVVQLGTVIDPATQRVLRESREDVERWSAIGRQLADRLEPDDIVVVGAAGALGVALPGRVVDFYGIVDRHIARTPIRSLERVIPGHVRSDADYLMSLEPAIIVVALLARDEPADDVADFVNAFWSRAHDDLRRHPGMLAYRPLNLRYQGRWVAVLERVPVPAPRQPQEG